MNLNEPNVRSSSPSSLDDLNNRMRSFEEIKSRDNSSAIPRSAFLQLSDHITPAGHRPQHKKYQNHSGLLRGLVSEARPELEENLRSNTDIKIPLSIYVPSQRRFVGSNIISMKQSAKPVKLEPAIFAAIFAEEEDWEVRFEEECTKNIFENQGDAESDDDSLSCQSIDSLSLARKRMNSKS